MVKEQDNLPVVFWWEDTQDGGCDGGVRQAEAGWDEQLEDCIIRLVRAASPAQQVTGHHNTGIPVNNLVPLTPAVSYLAVSDKQINYLSCSFPSRLPSSPPSSPALPSHLSLICLLAGVHALLSPARDQFLHVHPQLAPGLIHDSPNTPTWRNKITSLGIRKVFDPVFR